MSNQSFTDEFKLNSFELDKQLIEKCPDNGSDLKTNIRKRGSKRQSLTKTVTSIEENPPVSEEDIKFYIDKLSKLQTDVNNLDEAIEKLMLKRGLWTDSEYESQTELCENYSDTLCRSLLRLKVMLAEFSSEGFAPNNTVNDNSASGSKLKLPTVDLPTFDGEPESYHKFINSFENILGKFNLSQFEAFSYLCQQLSGPAKHIISSVPIDSDCYSTAKNFLTRAFSNKLTQQYSVISKLVKLKLNNVDSAYHWISEARVLFEASR